jgi:hypothetical protein
MKYRGLDSSILYTYYMFLMIDQISRILIVNNLNLCEEINVNFFKWKNEEFVNDKIIL